MSTSTHCFEAGPSIVELFNSAKKLLSLQTRVENRKLRKDNSKIQKQQTLHSKEGDAGKGNLNQSKHVLDLLSPLSIDDLKSSPPYIQKVLKNEKPIANITTPSSIDDSPPILVSKSHTDSNSGVRIKKEASNNLFNVEQSNRMETKERSSNLTVPTTKHISGINIKKEASTTISSVQVSDFKSNAPSTSNLTKSLSQHKEENNKRIECSNCQTVKTPLWRKDSEGNTLCNACGLFLKLHGTTRPLSLKTDVIKKRSSKRASNAKTAISQQVRNGNDPLHSNRLKVSNSSNFISIPNTNSSNGLSNSFHSHSSGAISISMGSRYKNVPILPKPPTTPNTPSSTSIPKAMENESSDSPKSPENGSSVGSQQFKRIKSEVSMINQDYYGDARRPITISHSKRNSITPSSFQSSPLSRRTSLTTIPQRQNSLINNNVFTPPSNISLTPSNSNIFGGKLNNTYFDNINTIFNNNETQNNNNNNVETPGSVTSQYSFASNNVNAQSFTLPSEFNSYNSLKSREIPTPMNTLSSLPSKIEDSMETDDFFKSYSQLQNDDNFEHMDDLYLIKREAVKSSLTNGFLNQTQDNDTKDLDWLKFEI